ncbi:MAG: ABC transporter permease [Candidatus Acidiferrales bacterium]
MSSSLNQLLARIRALFSKSEIDADLDQELESHIAMLVDENVRNGMSPQDARRAALIRIGARESTKELHREVRSLPWLDTLAQDLRYAVRTLRKDFAFALFAILIVSLGIGASCTIFSVVNALLLRPLPFKDPASLVWMQNHHQTEEDLSGQTTQVDYVRDLRRLSPSWQSLGAYMPFYGIGDTLMVDTTKPVRLTNVGVTDNFFDMLGVNMLLGRNFNAQEALGKDKVIIVSYNFWKRDLGGNPNIVGTTLRFDGGASQIIGVLPPSFDFGNIFAPGTKVDLFSVFPLTDDTNRWGNTLAVIGRLNPGVSIASAQSETGALAKRLEDANKGKRNDFEPYLKPLAEHISGAVRPAVILLACAVGVVMLIVCANLSNLLLARGASRLKELAIRSALGATRGRLIRQMLTESIVLSLCGAVVGLAFAFAGTRALAHLSGVSIPLLGSVTVDAKALAFTVAFALLTGIFFGLVPALQVPASRLNDNLQDSNRGSSTGRRHAWVRNAIVVSEVALACVLVVGAGLLIHSFLRVLDVNLGFHPEHAVTLRVDPTSNYDSKPKVNAYFLDLLQRVDNIPGVSAAGISDALPYGTNRTWGAGIKGVQYKPEDYPFAFIGIVSPGYFKAMGIPVIRGRVFEMNDPVPPQIDVKDGNYQHDAYCVINETMARNVFHGEDPIGRQMNGGATIIGIVGDTRHLSLEQDSGNEMYFSIVQTNDWSSANLVVRTALPNNVLASQIRTAVAPIAPDIDMANLRTLQSLVDKSVSPRRFVVMLLAGFAGFALILASLGIYAVVGYSVSQRTQEIGIRMALGASASGVRSAILKQTLLLGVIGMGIGLVAAAMLSNLLTSLLFGVHAADAMTFAAMLVIITLVALAAGYFPARRASMIDPIIALRSE